MLKDVGMAVPKSRETSVKKYEKVGKQYLCSKTRDEGSIYAARQGMRAFNNNNMRNPIIKQYSNFISIVSLFLLRLKMEVSVPSLHRESTDSLISLTVQPIYHPKVTDGCMLMICICTN